MIAPNIFNEAVKKFWSTREEQGRKQKEKGTIDQGARSLVTGGQQLNGFLEIIVDLIIEAGVNPDNIFTDRKLELPGYYRPSKRWDLVVVDHGKLLAAIELKSQVGPSFGNNFNNRSEEAIGSASDIWIAYREGAFHTSSQPWLGYLFVLEDCQESQKPVGVQEPHFPVFKEFRNSSYAKRYELLCRKLVLERQYSAACFIMTSRDKAYFEENYTEPASDLSVENFLTQLIRHIGKLQF
jgi:hypothetical protein